MGGESTLLDLWGRKTNRDTRACEGSSSGAGIDDEDEGGDGKESQRRRKHIRVRCAEPDTSGKGLWA